MIKLSLIHNQYALLLKFITNIKSLYKEKKKKRKERKPKTTKNKETTRIKSGEFVLRQKMNNDIFNESIQCI